MSVFIFVFLISIVFVSAEGYEYICRNTEYIEIVWGDEVFRPLLENQFWFMNDGGKGYICTDRGSDGVTRLTVRFWNSVGEIGGGSGGYGYETDWAYCNGDVLVVPRCVGELRYTCDFGCEDWSSPGHCIDQEIIVPPESYEPNSWCPPEEEVPEFSLIGLITVALLGVMVLIIIRRRH